MTTTAATPCCSSKDPPSGTATATHNMDSKAKTMSVSHHLEPLTATEIATAAAIVKKDQQQTEGLRFEMIVLCEPADKSLNNKATTANNRQANVSVYKLGSIGLWEYKVDLTEQTILHFHHEPQARAMIQLEEFMEIEDAVKRDPTFIKACARRGITNMDLVCVDPWTAGSFDVPGEEDKHLAHTFCWYKTSEFDNLYAHPIEGLNAIVDIKAQNVLRVDDYARDNQDIVPIPMENCNYETELLETPPRSDLKPINVVQPEGVSFRMNGNVLEKWHEWSMVVGFNAREGLTLHDIKYGGRSVLHRACIAEMVVPYGSPHGSHYRKNVFDIGEYGLGKLANSLELGCDCLGSIHYLDGCICDMNGDPYIIKNAICIHEEDFGLCWKHWDFRTLHTETRRNRRLVLSSVSTVGNYEYASYWYFYLDGTIEFTMKATGIINTCGCIPGEGGKYGTEVMPGVIGQIHQHHFCARLDLAIDGQRNTVLECDTIAEPPEKNPYGNAFYLQETPITQECGRRHNPDAMRFWKFISNEKTNHMGKPTAYKLEPMHSIAAFNDPNSKSGKRMGFIYNHLWVTPFDENERFPAGKHMNHSDGSDGLPVWTQKGRSVENKDIVAWHVFGLHHPVRMEDFPVQPVVSTGFKLMPAGFFDRNPCLDLPPDKNKASCSAFGTPSNTSLSTSSSTISESSDHSDDSSQE